MTRLRPVAAALFVLAACGGSDRFRPLQPGDPVPAYAAPNLNGDTVALATLRGQAVVLNVWATWCAPCREEMPELQALHERFHGRGLRVLGVSIDASGSEDPIRYFLARTTRFAASRAPSPREMACLTAVVRSVAEPR
jgi:thiol-disulfide isomerase/thioredoxin